MQPLAYMTGFGNSFETEALLGALPRGRNSPQRCPYGLYEVARAIAFLCSEESGMMTGSIVDFDQSVPGCCESPPIPAGRL